MCNVSALEIFDGLLIHSFVKCLIINAPSSATISPVRYKGKRGVLGEPDSGQGNNARRQTPRRWEWGTPLKKRAATKQNNSYKN